MPTKQITGLGKGGIIKDIPPVLLPEYAFTDGRNIRFDNESVEAITGEVIYKTLTTLQPDYGVHWERPDQGYNIFIKNGSMIRVDSAGNESSYILNSAEAKYSNSTWHTTEFNGGYAIVFNNGKSTPLYLLYGSASAGLNPQEIPNWNYYSGLVVTAKVIKSLGYSLVAANLTIDDNGSITNAPSTIRISVQAPTGGFPQTWEPGVSTDTADELEINSTSPILDMAELRGNMYIYSSDTIHVLSINTGVTRVQPYSKGYGILNQGCIAEFDGKHFVVDKNDIYIHGGSGSIESIANMRIRDYFFDNLNKTESNKVLVNRNSRNDEIWVCYPKGTSEVCNEALVYQYKNNTWSIRDLPNVTSMFNGPSPEGSEYLYSKERMYMLTGGYNVLLSDQGYSMWDGSSLVPHISYVSREKLNTGETLITSYINSISPIFDKVSESSSVDITVTGQNNFTNEADFSNTSGRDKFVFLPNDERNQGYKVDPRTSGRLLNYKIASQGPWRLALLGIDVSAASGR
jgi:hypothetical protein